MRSPFRACRWAPGQVKTRERIRSVQGVQKGLDLNDELGWQGRSLAANEAPGAASPVGADGHEAMPPEMRRTSLGDSEHGQRDRGRYTAPFPENRRGTSPCGEQPRLSVLAVSDQPARSPPSRFAIP